MATGICGQSAASLRHSATTGVSPNLLRAGHSLAAGAASVRPDNQGHRYRAHLRSRPRELAPGRGSRAPQRRLLLRRRPRTRQDSPSAPVHHEPRRTRTLPRAPPALPGQCRPLAHRDLQGQQRQLERERPARPLRPPHPHPRTGHGPHPRLLDRPTRALTSNPHTASLAARQAIMKMAKLQATTSGSWKPWGSPSPLPRPPDPALQPHPAALEPASPAAAAYLAQVAIFGSVLVSLPGAPRRRENGAGLPADAGVFLVVEAVESVWRRGLDLDGSRTVLRARGSDFRFPDRGPGHPSSWPTVR